MTTTHAPKILFVDDIPALCEEMVTTLRGEQLDADSNLSPLAAIPEIVQGKYDLVITGLVIAELGGFEIIRRIRGAGCRTPIIMITGFGTEQSAIEAARLGVADYLTKPIERKELIARVKRVLKQYATPQTEQPGSLVRMISGDPKMNEIFEKVKTIAPTDSRVLILGETGCGKQLLAHAIHQQSQRKQEPYVEVNCAAIPANLLESELFGHEEGSFTGATKRRVGRFETAGQGTIFLDEIGELGFDLQSKLLHVLDNGKFTRVGGNKELRSSARLVSATNRDLMKEVELGRFRADLYYRLNVISIELPPLRRRPGDIGLLAQHFINQFVPKGSQPPTFTPSTVEVLRRYPWPGNVRELQNVAEQLAVLNRGPRIEATDLPSRILQARPVETISPTAQRQVQLGFRKAKDQFEKEYLLTIIQQANGNLAEAARLAEMDRGQFYRLAKRHGLTTNTDS
ncbi:sigma-54-dependent transcriptional regulator [Blastopirellula retiformator]|uniref:Transcriptional regulatory protein ZraR n=1 Tax=Blastopirellula retiformator TaxID=2527970 RepID=A0A5C5V8T9_9BACT|nr:sigma-54 dependent transcriptional regulator [Blastopirellula retiformator]TWT34440.1 Transcriptional regulatory protein ZraR [Blastopirellula retiformator]